MIEYKVQQAFLDYDAGYKWIAMHQMHYADIIITPLFSKFEYRIAGVVYQELSDDFLAAVDKEIFWAKLIKDDMSTPALSL